MAKKVLIGPWNEPEGDIHGLEVGLINDDMNRDGGTSGLEVALKNWGSLNNGVQVGLINTNGEVNGVQIGCYNETNWMYGTQIGVLNEAGSELKGIQVGLICIAGEGNYLQLGLLTIRDTGPWYTRVTPFIGWHREKKSNFYKD